MNLSLFFRRVLFLRHSVCLIVFTVLFCYFFYPSWKLLDFNSTKFVTTAVFFTLSMALLLRLAMGAIRFLDADNVMPNNQLAPFEVFF